MQNNGCQSACFGFCRGNDGSRQQTSRQKGRNGDDLPVAAGLQLLNESTKKTFTHRNHSDATKSEGRVFKEDQSAPADGKQLFFFFFLPGASGSGSGKEKKTCRFGSASLGAVISGEPCGAHTLPGGRAALPGGPPSRRVQRSGSLLSTKAPGV